MLMQERRKQWKSDMREEEWRCWMDASRLRDARRVGSEQEIKHCLEATEARLRELERKKAVLDNEATLDTDKSRHPRKWSFWKSDSRVQ